MDMKEEDEEGEKRENVDLKKQEEERELKNGSKEERELESLRLKFHSWTRVPKPQDASLLNSFANLTTN